MYKLTKYVQDLYVKNYKSLTKKITETNEIFHVHGKEGNIINMLFPFLPNYMQCSLLQISANYFMNFDKLNLKLHRKVKDT